MSLSQRWTTLGLHALLALQWLWHALLLPPERAPSWLVALLFSLPLLPAAWLSLRGHRHAGYWGGVVSLPYFCHGISEAWASPGAWPLGLAEAGLAAWVVVAGSWAGLASRLGRKQATVPGANASSAIGKPPPPA